ncbi:MAG: hypothetical protein COV47_04410 [Candidatus Diapherotrites archaeon CG11_big_fil_rev_8_21_14_0_20_37_9]|nr:MAG: hypothetical protein COV47_04410 [Candidatus Diapherotrites archaeon CG11_big_fil_rev_8_21_14_0_20_37_9]
MSNELFFIITGILAGTFTGLIPGIHANTIAAIAIISETGNPAGFAVFIVSMSITHSFVDAIPNIMLGAPSEESFLTLLPGHKLLLAGKGFEAVQLTNFGGVIAGSTIIIASPILLLTIPKISSILPTLIPAILVAIVIGMLLEEKKHGETILVIGFSGALGLIALNSGISNPVFVLMIGFFAIPSLVHSITTKTIIPEQEKNIESKLQIKTGAIGAIVSAFIAMLPGIGPSQAAFIAKKTLKKINEKEYLILIGGVNTANLVMSLLVFFITGKTRTGMALALKQIQISPDFLLLLLATAIIAIGTASIITEQIAKKSAEIIWKINYKKISTIMLIALVSLTAYIGGILGLLAAITAAGITQFAVYSKIKRSHCMSFLIIPTIAIYLGISF